MKVKGMKEKMIGWDEADKAIAKARKNGEPIWFDYFNPIAEELSFISSSLSVMAGYCQDHNNGHPGPLAELLPDLEERVEKVTKTVDELGKKLREMERLGPHMTKLGKGDFFIAPRTVVEKYKLV